MTFLSSWRLLLLVAPIALLVAYLLIQRRRHTQVLRFTSVDLLDSVAPKRSGWQRHIPAAGVLASLVVLTIAFAQPAMALRTPVDRATILLTIDTSGSMNATDVDPSRLEAAQAKAREFVDNLPDGVQIGLVSFSSSAQLVVAPTKDHAVLLDGIDKLRAGGATATSQAIRTALAAVQGVPQGDDGTSTPAAIVLMSDGTPTVGDNLDSDPVADAQNAAGEAKAAGVPVDTIAFGTPDGTVTVQGRTVAVPIDVDAMASVAQASGGQSYTAETAGQLGAIYDQIGRDLAYTEKTQDISALVAGIALALAIGAAVAALFWTQRLI